MELTIALRDSNYVTISDFSSASSILNDYQTLKAEDIDKLGIRANITYTFTGSKQSITINGSDILYLQLDK